MPEPERDDAGRSPPPPLKPYREIFAQELYQAQEELKRPTVGLAMSGLAAGLGVGVSVLATVAVVTAMGGDLADGATRLLAANAFAIGFIIVILAHTDVFTEYTTIAIFAVVISYGHRLGESRDRERDHASRTSRRSSGRFRSKQVGRSSGRR